MGNVGAKKIEAPPIQLSTNVSAINDTQLQCLRALPRPFVVAALPSPENNKVRGLVQKFLREYQHAAHTVPTAPFYVIPTEELSSATEEEFAPTSDDGICIVALHPYQKSVTEARDAADMNASEIADLVRHTLVTFNRAITRSQEQPSVHAPYERATTTNVHRTRRSGRQH